MGLLKRLSAKYSTRATQQPEEQSREGELPDRTRNAAESLSGASIEPEEPEPHVAELEPHGLFILHPIPDTTVPRVDANVDIVAVHGLNGSARKTWTDSKTGKCWLEDFLPYAIPGSRIMTFGYDSKLAFSRSKAGIDSFARDLLNRLRMVRKSTESHDRPIVFIAHSLGGIVVKKALIIAHEAGDHYGSIGQSTIGIAFMATPHRGSDLVPWAKVFLDVVNLVTLGQGIRKSLLGHLEEKSTVLVDISQQFVHRAAALKIMSFTEQQSEHSWTTLIVPEYSAVLGLANEMVFPLNAHHRSICKYPSKNQNYLLVEAAIKELAQVGDERESNVTLEKAAKKRQEITLPVKETPGPPPPRSRTANIVKTVLSSVSSSSQSTKASDLNSKSIISRSSVRGSASAVFAKPTVLEEPISIRINGLSNKINKRADGKKTYSHTLTVPADTPLERLGSILLSEKPDLKHWTTFKFAYYGTEIDTTWRDVFTHPVVVTSERPCYDLKKGLKIHKKQTIASFMSKVFPHPVTANLRNHEEGKITDLDPFGRVSSEFIDVGREGGTNLTISLMRTIRVPEDNSKYELPPGLGRFPIFNMQPFSERLPTSTVAQGGLFIPMYQMEAMWINFDPSGGKRYAVRPFLGGVNGITGDGTMSDMATLLRRLNSVTSHQDYLVIPDQPWLDGIATSPGIVKQFVATSMTAPRRARAAPRDMSKDHQQQDEGVDPVASDDQPIGGTIEWQVTGQDAVGGLQLQLIPEFDTDITSASSQADVYQAGPDSKITSYSWMKWSRAEFYNVLKTPKELGLNNNGTIHVKDALSVLPDRPKLVRDLLVESPEKLIKSNSIEIELNFKQAPIWHFAIHLPGSDAQKFSIICDEDDEWDRVLDAVRESLALPNGTFCMKGMAKNASLIPVESWDTMQWIKDKLHPRDKLPPVDMLHTKDKLHPKDNEWILVLASPELVKYHRFCCVKPTGSTTLTEPICLALSETSTILDLKNILKNVSPELSSGFVIDEDAILPDDTVIFSSAREKYPRPNFTMWCDSNLTPGHDRGYQIFIKTLTGSLLVMEVEPFQTVLGLKKRIHAEAGIPPDQQRLIFANTQMHDDRILAQYGIRAESTIHLILRLAGGGYSILVIYQGKEQRVWFSGHEEMSVAKEQLSEKLHIPVWQQILTFEGGIVDDTEDTLSYANKVVTLTLAPRPTALGVGAGGNIIQHVERDTYDPAIWDVANSKILNIQIIDSTTFKSVTGLGPPKTPISAKTYQEMGLPFFELWRDEAKEDGVAGNWGPLQGVAKVASQNSKGDGKQAATGSGQGSQFGLLRSGAWGKVGADDSAVSISHEDFKEVGFKFPVVLLDVDATIPIFKSILDENWDEGEWSSDEEDTD